MAVFQAMSWAAVYTFCECEPKWVRSRSNESNAGSANRSKKARSIQRVVLEFIEVHKLLLRQ
jgi:hypothetical protein